MAGVVCDYQGGMAIGCMIGALGCNLVRDLFRPNSEKPSAFFGTFIALVTQAVMFWTMGLLRFE